MMISVHIPKTAGRSFRSLLKDHFGNHLRDDYRANPLTQSDSELTAALGDFKKFYSTKMVLNYIKGVQCFHGHFSPLKYRNYMHSKDHVFVTWLRDPIDRLVSHYFYRKQQYDLTVGTSKQKISHNCDSFEAFCFSDSMQNVYATYFQHFPLSRFDFIGITEHFESDIRYFSKTYFNKILDTVPLNNVTRHKEHFDCLNDAAFIESVKQFHVKDYALYNKAVALRQSRIEKFIT